MSQDELESLKQKADLMGITYHPSIGLEKLRNKIEVELNINSTDQIALPKNVETLGQKKARLRKEADIRVRCKVVCMNPQKQAWDGEFITVGNKFIGDIKVFVPFNVEAWHLPKIIIEALKEKQYMMHIPATSPNKNNAKQKWVKEFNVVILDPLTKQELIELATAQRAAGNLED